MAFASPYSSPAAAASNAIEQSLMQQAQTQSQQLHDQIALAAEKRAAQREMQERAWKREDREKEELEKLVSRSQRGDVFDAETQKKMAKYHILPSSAFAPSAADQAHQLEAAATGPSNLIPGTAGAPPTSNAPLPSSIGVRPGTFVGTAQTQALDRIGQMMHAGAKPEDVMAEAAKSGNPEALKLIEPWLRSQETVAARVETQKQVDAARMERQKVEDTARADRQREHDEFLKVLRSSGDESRRLQQELLQDRITDRDDKKKAVSSIAQGIKAGLIPPTPEGLGRTGAYVEVLGELASSGFNVGKAQAEWQATKRNIATLNGTQFKRLESAEKMVSSMADRVDRLAKQWDSAGLGPFSRARVEAAKQGALGQSAQSLATRYDQLTREAIGELAIVLKGGGTPTNEDRQFAEETLQNWWAAGTVLDVTEQMRATVNSRISITSELSGEVPKGLSRYDPKSDDNPSSKYSVRIE